MDGMGMMGMMTWGLLSMLLGLIILFLFILAAAYGVKWVLGQRTPSSTAHGETALDLLKRRAYCLRKRRCIWTQVVTNAMARG